MINVSEKFGGPDRDRTRDLFAASVSLSLLTTFEPLKILQLAILDEPKVWTLLYFSKNTSTFDTYLTKIRQSQNNNLETIIPMQNIRGTYNSYSLNTKLQVISSEDPYFYLSQGIPRSRRY